MGAFIVSDFHINFLVNWAANRHGHDAVSYYWNSKRREIRNDARRVASVLYAENVRSVNARYSQCENPSGFRFKPMGLGYLKFEPVQVIKACHCLTYQSCETSDWEQTEAHAILAAIIQAAIHDIAGYDDAEWHLNGAEVLA
jgi:hypothetical protein